MKWVRKLLLTASLVTLLGCCSKPDMVERAYMRLHWPDVRQWRKLSKRDLTLLGDELLRKCYFLTSMKIYKKIKNDYGVSILKEKREDLITGLISKRYSLEDCAHLFSKHELNWPGLSEETRGEYLIRLAYNYPLEEILDDFKLLNLKLSKESLIDCRDHLLFHGREFSNVKKIYELTKEKIPSKDLIRYAKERFSWSRKYSHPNWFHEGISALALAKKFEPNVSIPDKLERIIVNSLDDLNTNIDDVIKGHRLVDYEIKDIKDFKEKIMARGYKQIEKNKSIDAIKIAKYLEDEYYKYSIADKVVTNAIKRDGFRTGYTLKKAVKDCIEVGDKQGAKFLGNGFFERGYFKQAKKLYEFCGLQDRVDIINKFLEKYGK